MPVQLSIDHGIDVGKALEFRWKGMSFADIGAVMGVSAPAVIKRLSKFQAIVQDASLPKLFDEQGVSLLKAIHIDCLLALHAKLYDKKSTVNNLAFASKQLFDQVRLLEGKSTSNVNNLTRIIIQAHKLQEQTQDGPTNALEAIPSDLSGPLEASTARAKDKAPKGKGKRVESIEQGVGDSVGVGEDVGDSLGHGGD